MKKKKKLLYFKSNDVKDKAIDLLEWDTEEWKYQKKAKTLVTSKYTNVYIPGAFFKAKEYDAFKEELVVVEGLIMSSTMYVYKKIEDRFYEDLDDIYPRISVIPHGMSMFKKVKDSKFSTFSSEDRCAGKEKERAKVIKKYVKNYINLLDVISKSLKSVKSYTFRIDVEDQVHDIEKFVIGGKKAAKGIRFDSFMFDFVKRQQSPKLLDQITEKLYKKEIYNKMLRGL